MAVIRLVRACVVLMPHRTRLVAGRTLGRLAHVMDRRHARIALDNVTAAFPDQPAAWRRKVVRGVFAHLGRLMIELLVSDRELHRLRSRLQIVGAEHMEAVADAGRGYFLLSGHFGNWEWIALLHGLLGHPLWMVTRPLDNPYLERWLAATRSATGNRVVHKRNAVREIVRGLRERRGVAIVIDQHYPYRGPHMVGFFSRAAATTPALGVLAVRMGVPVLPVFAFPLPDGSYRVCYEEPIWPATDGDTEAAALAVTKEATKRIERAVCRQPEAWFWVHRRWRPAASDPDAAGNDAPGV